MAPPRAAHPDLAVVARRHLLRHHRQQGRMGILRSRFDQAGGHAWLTPLLLCGEPDKGEAQPVAAAFNSLCWRLMQSA